MTEKSKRNLVPIIVIGVLIVLVLIIYFATKQNTNGLFLQGSYEDYQKGQEYATKGDYQSAAEYYEKAVEAEPNNHTYVLELAVAKYNLKEYDEAITYYEKAISLNPNDAFAYNSLANAYRDADEPDKAADNYEKAVTINPNFTIAYHNWAIMLDSEGKRGEAVAVLNQGLEANPDSAELKADLAIINK